MWWTLFGSLFGMLVPGVWIGATLGITGIIIMHFWGPGIGLLGSATWDSINIYALTTLPGFIFMGCVIEASGISKRIYENVAPLMARFPGKLLHSNVLVSAMFAAVLGTSSGNAAVVGSVAIPELRKRKYNDRMILGTVCVAGTLGIMIPPSGPFILYGIMSDTSIAALFAAGTIPGILMALMYMTYIGIVGKLNPTIAPIGETSLPFKPTILSLLKIWPLIVIMVASVGPIYIGFCTPVEGSGIGSLAAIIMGHFFGRFNWEDLKVTLIKSTEITAMIFFLVMGAMILGVSVSTIGAPRAVVLWISELQVSPTVILMLIYVMYIIMGCFLDGISMVLLTLPFMMPVISGLGIDKVWFGVILTLLVEIGLVTPPVGLNLFVVQGISGPETSIKDIFMGSLPFVIITAGFMLLLSVFPQIATFFPKLIGLL